MIEFGNNSPRRGNREAGSVNQLRTGIDGDLTNRDTLRNVARVLRSIGPPPRDVVVRVLEFARLITNPCNSGDENQFNQKDGSGLSDHVRPARSACPHVQFLIR